MVARRGVFHAGHVDVVEQVRVAVEEDVRVEVQQLIRDAGHEVGKEPQKRVGRAVGPFVRASGKFGGVKVGHVVQHHAAVGIVGAERVRKARGLPRRDGAVGVAQVRAVHREQVHAERVARRRPPDGGEHTGQRAVKNAVVAAEQNVGHDGFSFPRAENAL